MCGTDGYCLKWAILACMHPIDVNADRRGKYVEHMGKYGLLLCLFASLSRPWSFALRNNIFSRWDLNDHH